MDYRALAREDAEGEEDPDVPQTFERLLSAGSEIRAGNDAFVIFPRK